MSISASILTSFYAVAIQNSQTITQILNQKKISNVYCVISEAFFLNGI